LGEIEIKCIKNLLEEDCTSKKIKEAVFEKFNVSVSVPTIFGFSFKRVSRVTAVSPSDKSMKNGIQ